MTINVKIKAAGTTRAASFFFCLTVLKQDLCIMKEKTGGLAEEVTTLEIHQSSEQYWVFQWGFPTIHLLPFVSQYKLPFLHVSSVAPLTSPSMQQVISIWVRDPRIQKNDFWHAYIDYEICLHVSRTNEMTVFTPPII